MKSFFIMFLLVMSLFITGCINKGSLLADLEGPVMEGIYYEDDNFLFRFNEAVSEFTLIFPDERELFVSSALPCENKYLPQNIFLEYQTGVYSNDKALFKASDLSGNITNGDFIIPFVNNNPASVKFTHIRLKHSSKLNEAVGFKVENEGNLLGFHIKIFANRHIHKIYFKPAYVKRNFEVIIENDRNTTEIPVITHQKGNVFSVVMENRLPDKCGVIAVFNYKGELLDYMAYFDSRDRALSDYIDAVYYKRLKEFISEEIDNPVFTDTAGNTAVKMMTRINDRFAVSE